MEFGFWHCSSRPVKMYFSSFSVTTEELRAFHRIDRSLLAVLVIQLCRDPIESVQILALWIWLERMGFDDIVFRMLSLPHILVSELADEASLCLSCINSEPYAWLPRSNDISLLRNLLNKEISIDLFMENRHAAKRGINKVIHDVCLRVFSDILEFAIERNTTAAAQKMKANWKMMAECFQPPLVVPESSNMEAGRSRRAEMVQPPVQEDLPVRPQESGIHPDDRTMFITFSKGYPVREREVLNFFTRMYGDCIESSHMQEVLEDEQPLFARLVFCSPSTIDIILNGSRKVKFNINGKHVWARKFLAYGAKTEGKAAAPHAQQNEEAVMQPEPVGRFYASGI